MKRLAIALILYSFFITSTADDLVPTVEISEQELRCLALNIHHEARGESLRGKIAVGQVTLNRTRNKNFPNTICNVVKQPYQFSWVNIKNISVQIPMETYQIAIDLINSKYKDVTKGALYFHNISVASFNRRETVRIGNHIFYS